MELPATWRQRLPGRRVVRLLALIHLAQAVLAASGAVPWVAASLRTGHLAGLPSLLDALGMGIASLLVVAMLALVALRQVGWPLAVSAQVAALAYALLRYLAGRADYPSLALGVLAVTLLHQEPVRQVLRAPDG
jgi:hypothetical protein